METYDISPAVQCPRCGCEYFADSLEDEHAHRVYHRAYEHVAEQLGRRPLFKSERERLKDKGDDLRRRSDRFMDKVTGAKMVLQALYDRELLRVAAKGNLGPIESFDAYTARQDLENLFPGGVGTALRRNR